MKRMIFHHPLPLDPTGNSGSHIRPIQMLKAFKENGYEVDLVTGYGKERAQSLKEISKKIEQGQKYEFLYSETSTMPLFLTEKHHLPVYFWVELYLFILCKFKQIPIAIYYRDIHWKFNFFAKGTSSFKRLVSFFFYYIELLTIKLFCNVLFLPSIEMQKVIPILKNFKNAHGLPPGITDTHVSKTAEQTNKNVVNLIYVGGVHPPLYDISMILKAVKNCDQSHLHLVCRKEDLGNLAKSDYTHDRITIYHASGKELESIYNKADLAVVALGDHPYHDFSMPVKMFEAISYGRPILVSSSMKAASHFVSASKVGYVVNNEQDIQRTITSIVNDPKSKQIIDSNILAIQNQVSWKARANEVSERAKGISRDS